LEEDEDRRWKKVKVKKKVGTCKFRLVSWLSKEMRRKMELILFLEREREKKERKKTERESTVPMYTFTIRSSA